MAYKFWSPKGGDYAGLSGGLQAEDFAFVAKQHERGASAQSIARMTGFSVDTIRAALSVVAVKPEPKAPPPVIRDVIVVGKPLGRGHQIVAEMALGYGLTVADLTGPRRDRCIAHPRQHAMWEVRSRTDLSLPQIGRLFGGRDHTTVLHGLRAYEARLSAQREAA